MIGSITEHIGRTPLLHLQRISKSVDGNVLAKLEYLNPCGSKKDRVALHIIEAAEAQGILGKGQHIIELTSGNMGTGLALICQSRGYPFTAVMSKGNSPERATMMRALGASVVLVDQAPGGENGKVSGEDLALVEERTQALTLELDAFRIDQFQNEHNPISHYLGTGKEILEQSDLTIHGFCDFVGTGGTFQGCAQVFRSHDTDISCYVIEPKDAAVLAKHKSRHTSHLIQGGGYNMAQLPLLDRQLIDGFLQVTDEEVISAMKMLALKEGVFAGPSSGANLAGALQLLKGPLKGKNIVVIICDSGMKYMQSNIWT